MIENVATLFYGNLKNKFKLNIFTGKKGGEHG